MPHRLSKSRFTSGLQCHKKLWWEVHEPDAVELQPDKVLQDLFDQGRQVGELARGRYSGGVLIDAPHNARTERVAATAAALDSDAPAVFEATYIADACGVEINSAEVMHLNKEFRNPDVGDLFARTDVTEAVAKFLPNVPDELGRQKEMLAGALPDVPIGLHCSEPRECPFMKRCWPDSPDHIVQLCGVGPKRAAAYFQRGIQWIRDLPPTERLNFQQRRQLKAMAENRLIVEPTLAKELKPFTSAERLGFLDFETIMRAVPVWPGMAPWQQAPAQFSYHERQPDGTYTHAEFLAEGPKDCRPELARAMV